MLINSAETKILYFFKGKIIPEIYLSIANYNLFLGPRVYYIYYIDCNQYLRTSTEARTLFRRYAQYLQNGTAKPKVFVKDVSNVCLGFTTEIPN